MLKILVVEDDKFISAIFSFFIKDLGHTLMGRCQSGAAALEMCEKDRPDVVLMDIHLEGEMDGIQTAERLQRDYEVPVIFISSDTSSNIVERAIIANSYGYLVKPVQKKELGITIDLAYFKHKVTLDQKRREQSFRQFISDAPIPMVIITNKRIQYLNMNALDLFHSHYIEDIIGLPFTNFVGAESIEDFDRIFNEPPVIGKKIERFDAVFKGLHGKEIDVVINGSWIRFNNNDAIHLILSDISSEKLALHEALILKEILREGHGAIMELNAQLEVCFLNKAFDELIQYAGDCIGKSLFDLSSLMVDKEMINLNISKSSTSTFNMEINTSVKKLKCKVYPINTSAGKPERYLISVIEVLHIQ